MLVCSASVRFFVDVVFIVVVVKVSRFLGFVVFFKMGSPHCFDHALCDSRDVGSVLRPIVLFLVYAVTLEALFGKDVGPMVAKNMSFLNSSPGF